jgi:phosphoglycerate dehydrogenase-like enzyme
VDEAALLDALDSGKLHGVGLDVYADEPRINSELFKHPNVTLLPHMGTEWVLAREHGRSWVLVASAQRLTFAQDVGQPKQDGNDRPGQYPLRS